ncbi:hypothetical protein TNCV_4815741 [Trichonephila clavipes]|nr:hypothetical protein TNCV_4815741 [Trichonephila clavipes]
MNEISCSSVDSSEMFWDLSDQPITDFISKHVDVTAKGAVRTLVNGIFLVTSVQRSVRTKGNVITDLPIKLIRTVAQPIEWLATLTAVP